MIWLDIGREDHKKKQDMNKVSKHVINLKDLDSSKKPLATAVTAESPPAKVIKKEIELKKTGRDRIQIVGGSHFSGGLGRIPMLAAAMGILLVLNLGQIIFLGKQNGEDALALAGEGFVSLQNAGGSLMSGDSDAELFLDAQKLFDEAKEKGSFLLNSNSKWLTEPKQVQSLKNLLSAGSLMAEVGTHIANAKLALTNLPKEGSLTEYLSNLSDTELTPAAEKINQIDDLLDGVDLSGTGYEEKFASFKEKLTALRGILNTYLAAKDPLLTALGDKYPQHYLVLLENNDEMRPGGGFIGSFAIVEINDGRLTSTEFHDVYEFDNRYFKDLEVPIHELAGLTNNWRLRDSNTSLDFPTSAENAAWFLEQEGGMGVDGVIAVNLSSAQAFLEATGPIKIASLPEALTAQTFPAVVTTLVEAKVNKNAPKTILQDVLNAFLDKAKQSDSLLKLGATMLTESQKKQILFYHKDPAVEDLIKSMDFDGEIPILGQVDGDFFMPVFTNIGGNKTDRYITTDITHDTQILDDNSIVSTITLNRTHTFTADTMSWIKDTLKTYGFSDWNPGLESILGNAKNRTGIRFYVPEGSQLLGVTGAYRDDFQYYYDSDQDLSYYYLDQTLAPGETKEIRLQFALPWKFDGNFKEYKFSTWHQPGLKAVTFKKTVAATGKTLLSADPTATEQELGTDYLIQGNFEKDLGFTLLYK